MATRFRRCLAVLLGRITCVNGWASSNRYQSACYTPRGGRQVVRWVSDDDVLECSSIDEQAALVSALKRRILELGASYDRGFGASPSARDKARQLIQDLERCNMERSAARGMDGNLEPDDYSASSPLRGSWRMVWTSAFDVLALEASPLTTTAAIYQVFDPPVVTNVIDFLPRIQTALPVSGFPNSLVRVNVSTRGSERPGQPNRVGLVFERVYIQPLQLLGMMVDVFPPIGFDLPKLPSTLTGEGTSPDAPGYFDVTYLDDEFLIIQQNAPGGVFVLIRVDSIDP